MACNSRSSCNSADTRQQLDLLIRSILFELLNDGTLQAGLKDCEGDWLGKGRKVVLCDALADLLCDLINEGKLCVPKIAAFTSDCVNKTLTISMADGTELTADVSCLGGGGGGVADGNTTITGFNYDRNTGQLTITESNGGNWTATIQLTTDSNTKNKAMAWDVAKQEVSVTDTDDNKVSTPVLFTPIATPNKNTMSASDITHFIGTEKTSVLTTPTKWIQLRLDDGTVVKIPGYMDVVIVGCPPMDSSTANSPGAMVSYYYVVEGQPGATAVTDIVQCDNTTYGVYLDVTCIDDAVARISPAPDLHKLYVGTSLGWFKYDQLKAAFDFQIGSVDGHWVSWSLDHQGNLMQKRQPFVRSKIEFDGGTPKVTDMMACDNNEIKLNFKIYANDENHIPREIDFEFKLADYATLDELLAAWKDDYVNRFPFILAQISNLNFIETPWGYITNPYELYERNTPINLITLDNTIRHNHFGIPQLTRTREPSGYVITGGQTDPWTLSTVITPTNPGAPITLDPIKAIF